MSDDAFDAVIRAKMCAMRDLLSRPEVERREDANGVYLEFRFPEDTDFSCFSGTDDRGHRFVRVGRAEDMATLYAFQFLFCRCSDAEGDEVGTVQLLSELMREYTRRHGGKASGENWFRVSVPPTAVRFFIHATRVDGKKEPYTVGQWFARRNETDVHLE